MCPPGEYPVRADAVQMRRMLGDLVRKAIEAMPDGGSLRLGVALEDYDAEAAARRPALAAGPHVVLTVADSGVGIPEADRSRVFEPFFNTKRMAPGMGLTTAYGVVARCGGDIALESVPGGGTTVVCSFPLAAAAAPAAARGRAPGIGAGQTVLVAEDATLALLVTDVVMPRMGGRELAARLRERSPGLRVLVVSGFTDGALGDAGDPATSVLPKPFMSAELADAVRSLLEPEAAPA